MIPSEVQSHGFENLNPYGSVVALTANSPDELALAISSIKAPIKILGFNSYGTKQVCYFLASGFKIKKTEIKKIKEK